MKKVVLKLYDLNLCEFFDNEGELSKKENEKEIKTAKEKYPFNMREYKNGISGFVYPIENYFNAINRKDIIKEANIKETDTVFEKIYKVAGLEIEPINGFSISRG